MSLLACRIAARYLRAPKSHTAVTVISSISIAGIAVATAAIICVLSVFNGFGKLASDRLSILDPVIKLVPTSGKTIANSDSIVSSLSSLGIQGVVPTVEEKALAVFNGKQMPVTLKGVGKNYELHSKLSEAIIDGQYRNDSILWYPAAALSVGSAIQLGAGPGYYDMLRIYMPKRVGRINPDMPMAAFRADSMLVEGVFQTDQPELDNSMVIVPVETARKLLDYTGEATAIEIHMPSETDIDKMMGILHTRFPYLQALDRYQQHPDTYRMISMEKWITLMLMVFILAIASFNIISSLSMLILEKRADLFTLDALGARPRFIRNIYRWQGVLLTLSGGVIGIITGTALVLAQQYGGFIKLGGDHSQMSITVYPVELQISDLLLVALCLIAVAIPISALGGYIASRTSRLRATD